MYLSVEIQDDLVVSGLLRVVSKDEESCDAYMVAQAPIMLHTM
jgi:hypothetical protein